MNYLSYLQKRKIYLKNIKENEDIFQKLNYFNKAINMPIICENDRSN
jgi:hypothetical protein